MTLERICFILVITGLICLQCFPLTSGTQKVVRVTVVVAGVLWTILQFTTVLPVR